MAIKNFLKKTLPFVPGGALVAGGMAVKRGMDRRKASQAQALADDQARVAEKQRIGLESLGQMQRPELDPAMQARLRALEDESRPTALVEDPEFQADRTAAVQGGAQALAGIQNRQAATGATGGFSNVGSTADTFDRLGAQLAQLGQQSRQRKSQKAQQAAEARQSLLESQTQFGNEQARLRAAIQSGSIDEIQGIIDQARAREEERRARRMRLLGQTIGGAATIGGALIGGPAGAAVGRGVGQAVSGS